MTRHVAIRRRYLLGAGVGVALAVSATIAIGGRADVTPTATPTPVSSAATGTASSPTPSTDAGTRSSIGPGSVSICGLADGRPLTGKLPPPKAAWKYDGVVGYPASSTYGPGRTDAAGFRYCYQHSAAGALFAAAGSIAFNNRSKAAARAWSRYSLAEGPYRDQLLDSTYLPADPAVRPATIGYRLLSYDAEHAKVDLAVRLSTDEQTMLTSVVMDLVWQRGDWRFSTDVADSVQAARLADLTGYTGWSDV